MTRNFSLNFCLCYLITTRMSWLAQPVFIVPPYYCLYDFAIGSSYIWGIHRLSIFNKRLLCKILIGVYAVFIINRELDSNTIITFRCNNSAAKKYYNQERDHFALNQHSRMADLEFVFVIYNLHKQHYCNEGDILIWGKYKDDKTFTASVAIFVCFVTTVFPQIMSAENILLWMWKM